MRLVIVRPPPDVEKGTALPGAIRITLLPSERVAPRAEANSAGGDSGGIEPRKFGGNSWRRNLAATSTGRAPTINVRY